MNADVIPDALTQRQISIFIPSLRGGGAERAMVNLARGMHELGHGIDLVVGTAEGPYRSELRSGINLVDLGERRMVKALPKLVAYLRRRQPKILYSALGHANVVALCATWLAGAPTRVIVSLREMPSGPVSCGFQGVRERVLRRLECLLYPYADGIIAVSSGVARDAEATLGLDRYRVKVISNPVLTPEMPAQGWAKLHHPWFASDEPPVVLACGRLSREKDFSTLLEAFAIVRQQRMARLVILGDGPDRVALLQQAGALGIGADVALLGFDSNPFRFMTRAHIFVLSSLREGSPNVVIQALACGCAVVATDCGGGTREILDGVKGASLVPVGNVLRLAKAIDTFLEAGVDRFGPRLLSRFDYRASAVGYLSVAGIQ